MQIWNRFASIYQRQRISISIVSALFEVCTCVIVSLSTGSCPNSVWYCQNPFIPVTESACLQFISQIVRVVPFPNWLTQTLSKRWIYRVFLTKLYFAFAKTDGRGSSAQWAGDQYFTFLCSIDLRCNVRGSFQFLIKVDNALFWARPTYPGFFFNLVTQEHKLGIIIILFH